MTEGHVVWVDAEHLEDRPIVKEVLPPPVLCGETGRWLYARDLQVGDLLLLKTGEQVPILRTMLRPVCEMVYNFSVEALECYAVGISRILVHNSSTPPAVPAAQTKLQ